ncbi:unnamed protein product [Owenia fusiformis]|uniref:DNA polymerase eta n=1 Tax=Owenia fusiformis TaxID=6347 RepID=A0A8J1XWW0_OWEFU|nr:unnamed protein product [Owenia fusiformis]
MSSTMAQQRVIALVDMDCFYVQVEQRRNPSLKGKPCAVVQYKTWKGGGIIAVGYEARACGVTRQMRGDEAKEKCPAIELVRVPEVRGKADLTRYRDAGAEVIAVLCRFSDCVERASVDEAYIDLTEEVQKRLNTAGNDSVTLDKLPCTHVTGFEDAETTDKETKRQNGLNAWTESIYHSTDDVEDHSRDQMLTIGAVIAEEMRAAVFRDTGFHCSAGIAHNKMLAKLACGLNKPRKQTILPHSSVNQLFQTLSITKLRSLGGKLGEQLQEQLGVEKVADLCKYSEQQLQQIFGDKTGTILYGMCRGEEHEPVTARLLPKSVGCGKNFRGREMLDTRTKVKHWIHSLAEEVTERLEKDKLMNKRVAKNMTIGVGQLTKPSTTHSSRSCTIVRYDAQKIGDDAFAVLQKFNTAGGHQEAWVPAIVNLSISAGKFQDEGTSQKIKNFFSQSASSPVFTSTQSPDASQSASSFAFTSTPATQTPVRPKQNVKAKPTGIAKFFSSKVNTSIFQENPNDSSVQSKVLESNERNVPFSECESTQALTNSDLTVNVDSAKSTTMLQSDTFTHLNAVNTKDDEIIKDVPTTSTKSFFKTYMQRNNINMGNENEKVDSFKNSRSGVVSDITGEDSDTVINKTVFSEDTNESTAGSVQHVIIDDNVESDSCNNSLVDNEPYLLIADNRVNGLTREENRPPTVNNSNAIIDDQSVSIAPIIDTNCSDSANEASDYSRCEKCNEMVSAWDLPEHLDFHYALELQNQPHSGATVQTAPSVKRKSTSQSKRGRKKSKLNNDSSNMQTLDTFFSKN